MNKTPDILAALRAEIQSAQPDELPAIIGQVEAVKAEAFARLVAPAAPAAERDDDGDRLLTVEEVAALMGDGTTSRWVRDHASQLGRVAMPGRALRFSEKKLQRIIARRSHG